MKIFYGDVQSLTKQVMAVKRKELTNERLEQIDCYKQEADQKRGFAAGLLLEHGLRTYGLKQREICLQRNKNGKLFIKERSDVQFNLTHSGNYAVIVFDDSEVGIDIEQQEQAKMKIAKRFFTEEENEVLLHMDKAEREKAFTRIWTRKESYIKAIGLGLQKDLRSFSTLRDEMREDDFFFHTYEVIEGYQISVCAKKPAFPRKIEQINLLEV